MRLLLAVLGFQLTFLSSVAQGFELNVEAPNFKGFPVEVLAYKDWITRNTMRLSSSRVGQDGTFSLKVNADPDTLPMVFLRLGGATTSLFVSPGKIYDILIPATDPGRLQMRGDNDTNERWYRLLKFEQYYDQYVVQNEAELRSPRARIVVNRFAREADSVWSQQPDTFVWQTARYRAAYTQLALRTRSEQRLIRDYVFGNPVRYTHPDYMQFFLNLYPQKFLEWTLSSRDTTLKNLVHNRGNYTSIMEVLYKKEEITGREVAELTFVSGLWNLYQERLLAETRLVDLLIQIRPNLVHPSLRAAVRSMLEKVTFFQKGSKLPALEFRFWDGKPLALSSLTGKYLYLAFFEASRTESLTEMLATKALADRYKNELLIVGICTDCNYTMLDRFLKEYKPVGTYALANQDELEGLSLITPFQAYLIDKEGIIRQSPALSPGDGADAQVYDLIRKVPKR
jgi:hypothetical protein